MHVPAESDCTMCRPGQSWTCPLRARQECYRLGLKTGQLVSQTESCLQTGPLPVHCLPVGTALLIILNWQTPWRWTCHLGKKWTALCLIARHHYHHFVYLMMSEKAFTWFWLDLWKLLSILSKRVKLVHSKPWWVSFPLYFESFFLVHITAVISLLLLACLLQRVFVELLNFFVFLALSHNSC